MYKPVGRIFFFWRRCYCGGIIWPFTKWHRNTEGAWRSNEPRPNVYGKHDGGFNLEFKIEKGNE